MTTKYWSMDVHSLMSELGTREQGLDENEAQLKLGKYGENVIETGKKRSKLSMFISQFTETLVEILIASAIVAGVLGQVVDAIAILVIVFLNAIIGFYQELNAEKSLEALKKMVKKTATVRRQGKIMKIESRYLVPGDIILLEPGDIVPADARILKSYNLKVNEAVLTGESLPVEKRSSKISSDYVADRANTVFASTVVVSGKAEAVVVNTGMNTEFGKIAKSLQMEEGMTPLQKQMDVFGKKLTVIIFLIIGVVGIAQFIKGEPLVEVFLFAISLAVAAVPEGLPAVMTITMALGVRKMAERKAVARRLYAVEALGSVDYICTDKTGTLTKNEMTVRKIWVPGKELEVTGTGYFEDGRIEGELDEQVKELILAGLYCNDASLYEESYVGDTTDVALLVLAKKAGMKRELEIKDEIPFSSEEKMMAVRLETGKVYIKGAPEILLQKSSSIAGEPADEKMKKQVMEKIDEYASAGYRVIGLASGKSMKSDFNFIGLAAIIDPPRPEVAGSIRTAKEAGIHVVMITGDHALIARKIAEEVGIYDGKGMVIEGKQLDTMTDEELAEKVEDIVVYARTTPEHKLRIVRALQAKGHVVAMTGDGVNDAPALKMADVGVAMGITGTDVTQDVADLVLMDDNFSTIVAAVEEGRRIYSNMLKFIKYLLRANLGEIMIMFIPSITSLPNPLYPVHLLMINLLTDGFPALALGMDKSDKDLMKKKPRKRDEPIITKDFMMKMAVAASVIAALVLAVFVIYLHTGKAVTMAFATLVMLELTYAVGVKTEKPFANPFSNMPLNIANATSIALLLLSIYTPLSFAMRTVPLSLEDWAVVGAAVLIMYIEQEMRKIVWK